jgi:serine/threonine protein kinase
LENAFRGNGKNLWGGLPRFIGITRHPRANQYAFVMEYFADANLRNFQQQRSPSWTDRYWVLKRIAYGLHSAHANNIIHCDLHSGNVLSNNWSKTKVEQVTVISDFGLSKNLTQSASVSKGGSYGIIPYMAPELLQGQAHTKASDVYALAMIMWELSSGEPPFNNRSHNHHLIWDICKGVRPPISESTPKCWIQLMQQCWDNDAEKRPTANKVWHRVDAWWRDNKKEFHALFPDGEAQPRAQQPTIHPRSVYTSRFIPSLNALETYANSRNLEINEISDDEWETIVSYCGACL